MPLLMGKTGGEGGIRTPVGVTPELDFESSTFGLSVTSPPGHRYILNCADFSN